VPAVAGFLFGKAAVLRKRKHNNPVSINCEELLVNVMLDNYNEGMLLLS
jgi:hypothetical protein